MRASTAWGCCLIVLAASGSGMAVERDSPHRETIVDLYRRSPATVHQRLKRQVLAGGVPRHEIELLEKRTGDRSFSALLEADPALRRALELQSQALEDWESGRRTSAISGYESALRLLDPRKHRSELAFCQYLIAEILTEQELYPEGLARLETALELADGENFRYLEALLHQSRGYSLWFLDRLPDSARAFAVASRLWERIGFPMGRLACRNNLAALYEELGMEGYAEAHYLEALSQVTQDTYPEIRLQVLLNFAKFLHRRGEVDRSRTFLRLAAFDRAADEAEFSLAEAEIEGRIERLPAKRAQPSVQAQSELLRLRRWPGSGDLVGRLGDLLAFCRRHGLRRQERVVSLELGRELERRGLWAAAAGIYGEAIRRAELVVSPTWVFPFPEALAPHLAGWVRSLVRSGQPAEALAQIRGIAAARTRLLEAADWDRAEPGEIEDEWEIYDRLTGAASEVTAWRAGELDLPPDTVLLELWPDGEEILAWVQQEGRIRFRRLEGTVPRTALGWPAPDVRALPPAPSARELEELSRVLVHNLEGELQAARLVLVPHGVLRSLPFELLTTASGRLMGDRWILSYLPAGVVPATGLELSREPPLAVVPESFRSRDGGRREREFLAGRPQPVPVLTLDRLPTQVRARWLYWSSHLIPHPRFWHLSRLTDGSHELRLFELVRRRLHCRLLVLAACDGGRVQDGHPADWLGLSSLLLSRGSSSLLLSRWQLDERSVPILLQALEDVEAGRAIDESLAAARRAYLARCGGDSACRHPFFWAGIMYVGPPGLRAGPEAGGGGTYRVGK